MKKITLQFILHNWFKIAIALLLTSIALQDELNFQINLKNPEQQAAPKDPPKPASPTNAILSDKAVISEAPAKTNRFNTQPFLPRWRNQEKPNQAAPPRTTTASAMEQLARIDPEELDQFIRRFAQVASQEQHKFGIPASIIIANGLLMSTADHSILANDYHNFFRLPCGPFWEGEQVAREGKCYRVYSTAWLSFRDHSKYLAAMREAAGVQLSSTDYQAWARFLQQHNFAEEGNLEQQLVQLIQDMELFYLDQGK
jgi:flagellum-specific peptidoglycan hydrolase FlgJ